MLIYRVLSQAHQKASMGEERGPRPHPLLPQKLEGAQKQQEYWEYNREKWHPCGKVEEGGGFV